MFALFGGLSLISKLIAVGSLILVIVAAYGVWHHKIYQKGYDRAIADIAAQDAKAIERAQRARGIYKLCEESGRRWDTATGTCAGG